MSPLRLVAGPSCMPRLKPIENCLLEILYFFGGRFVWELLKCIEIYSCFAWIALSFVLFALRRCDCADWRAIGYLGPCRHCMPSYAQGQNQGQGNIGTRPKKQVKPGTQQLSCQVSCFDTGIRYLIAHALGTWQGHEKNVLSAIRHLPSMNSRPLTANRLASISVSKFLDDCQNEATNIW